MKITDHGVFTPYVPSPERLRELGVEVAADPETGSRGFMFTKSSQGVDFYDMEADGVFIPGAMLVSVTDQNIVISASFVGDRVLPVKDCRLLELSGDDVPASLQKVTGKMVDIPAGKLVDPPPPVPASVSDRQFFQALAMRGEITPAEALAAVKTGDIPAAMQAMVDAIPDAAIRFGAQMMISGATSFERQHILVDTFASGYGWSKEQTDDFFRFAATL